MLDLRLPIGWLFIILGSLVAAWGILKPTETSCGAISLNLNLSWGLIMLLFGLGMTFLARLNRQSD